MKKTNIFMIFVVIVITINFGYQILKPLIMSDILDFEPAIDRTYFQLMAVILWEFFIERFK